MGLTGRHPVQLMLYPPIGESVGGCICCDTPRAKPQMRGEKVAMRSWREIARPRVGFPRQLCILPERARLSCQKAGENWKCAVLFDERTAAHCVIKRVFCKCISQKAEAVDRVRADAIDLGSGLRDGNEAPHVDTSSMDGTDRGAHREVGDHVFLSSRPLNADQTTAVLPTDSGLVLAQTLRRIRISIFEGVDAGLRTV